MEVAVHVVQVLWQHEWQPILHARLTIGPMARDCSRATAKKILGRVSRAHSGPAAFVGLVAVFAQPLHEALFSAPSPGPSKYALSLLGLCEEEVRLPLVECPDPVKQKVRAAMEGCGLL